MYIMKKLLTFFAITSLLTMNAQKIRNEDFGFLRGEKELNIEFDYSDVIFKFNGDDGIPESKYVERQLISEGEEWKEMWEVFKEELKSGIKHPNFIREFNLSLFDKGCMLRGGNFENANYTLLIKIKTMCTAKTGFIAIDDPYIECSVTFKDNTSNNTISQIQIGRTNGKPYYSYYQQFESVYENIGKDLGKSIAKNIK